MPGRRPRQHLRWSRVCSSLAARSTATSTSEVEGSGCRANPTPPPHAINAVWRVIPSPHTSAPTSPLYDSAMPEVTAEVRPSVQATSPLLGWAIPEDAQLHMFPRVNEVKITIKCACQDPQRSQKTRRVVPPIIVNITVCGFRLIRWRQGKSVRRAQNPGRWRKHRRGRDVSRDKAAKPEARSWQSWPTRRPGLESPAPHAMSCVAA
ncbi:hypothetical protein B296_00000138 [Ensete ventricosum]|uniref:Uncharacterized protein n=1 Tax=Ensete ventricosum TaxID=4639 RepID=A0A427B700_ENSVE|nr:hypothetical protein B296_00000138 [Ensete ventricosum]